MNPKRLTTGLISLGLITGLLMASNNHNKEEYISSKNSFQSSIQILKNSSETDEQNAAKINISEVYNIVSKHLEGKITRIILENVDGNLIYNAEILANNHSTDVIVDAGNGTILATNIDKPDAQHHEKEDDDDNHDKH